MRIAIRADGGPDIGFGHLVRSSSLASALLRLGVDVTYATTTPESASEVAPDGIDVVELPSRGDPAPFCEWLDSADTAVDGVFVDCYPVDTAYQRAVRDRVPLAVHDDDGRHTIDADVLVNGNLYASEMAYDYAGEHPVRLLGPDYLLIGAEIRDLAARDPPWRDPPERAVVSLGGSDVARLTPTAVRAFDGLSLAVDVVVGPGFDAEQAAAVRAAAEEVSTDTAVVRDPDDLSRRFFEADLAVTACGSTVYELLALGTPMVCFPVVDNQRRIASALATRDAATVLDRDPDETALRSGIEAYLDDPDLRRTRRDRGRKTVDGRGAVRVAEQLVSRWGQEGEP